MPRKPSEIPSKEMRVQCPLPLHEQIERVLYDPINRKRAYGSFSNITCILWIRFLQEQGIAGLPPLTDEQKEMLNVRALVA